MIFFSYKPHAILSSPCSTTGLVDTSTSKSNTSKSNGFEREMIVRFFKLTQKNAETSQMRTHLLFIVFFFSLFPMMPRHNYHLVAPRVRAMCEKHGVPYEIKSLWRGMADVVR